jgi:hypothetical protein
MLLGMDTALSGGKHTRNLLVRGISPLIVASILQSMWDGGSRGGSGAVRDRQGHALQEASAPMDSLSMKVEEKDGLVMVMVSIKSNSLKCRGSLGFHGDTSLDGAGPLGSPVVPATTAADLDPTSLDTSNAALFDKLKKECDLAKAVKNNNAKVPVHLWDTAVWAGAPIWLQDLEGGGTKPSEVFKQAMSSFRQLGVRLYQWKLWKKIYAHLVRKYGHKWVELGRRGGSRGARVEVKAAHEILWQAANNDWFEYPMGSGLLHFCFPTRYQTQAMSGVGVYYTKKSPTAKRLQPPLGNDKKTVLLKKIQKFMEKEYILPVEGQIGSSVFCHPKRGYQRSHSGLEDCIPRRGQQTQ